MIALKIDAILPMTVQPDVRPIRQNHRMDVHDGGFATARSAVQDVRDPAQLARRACLALAGIDATSGNY